LQIANEKSILPSLKDKHPSLPNILSCSDSLKIPPFTRVLAYEPVGYCTLDAFDFPEDGSRYTILMNYCSQINDALKVRRLFPNAKK
jgi:hypothetical protein